MKIPDNFSIIIPLPTETEKKVIEKLLKNLDFGYSGSTWNIRRSKNNEFKIKEIKERNKWGEPDMLIIFEKKTKNENI